MVNDLAQEVDCPECGSDMERHSFIDADGDNVGAGVPTFSEAKWGGIARR